MALSSGTRSFLAETASWAVAAVLIGIGAYYHKELGSAATAALGLQSSPETELADAAGKDAPAEKSNETMSSSGGVVEIRASETGHYHAQVEVNGEEIEVMVDTGATMLALTHEDAERAGIYPKESDYTMRARTANGIAKIAPVRLSEVTIGDITVRNVDATVSEPGVLNTTLLGMSFLSKLDKFEIRQGILVLQN
jgi:aspartyl protease family protein